jgi:protein involved in ribonucleotide reduction
MKIVEKKPVNVIATTLEDVLNQVDAINTIVVAFVKHDGNAACTISTVGSGNLMTAAFCETLVRAKIMEEMAKHKN